MSRRNVMITIRKALTGTITALVLGATVITSATPASADWRGHRRHGGHGGGKGAAIAAGIIGGLALGALAAGAARADTRRSYYAPAPAYAPSYSFGGCYDIEKPAYNRWGQFLGYRLVTVCD
jgi:hypothetical protein